MEPEDTCLSLHVQGTQENLDYLFFHPFLYVGAFWLSLRLWDRLGCSEVVYEPESGTWMEELADII